MSEFNFCSSFVYLCLMQNEKVIKITHVTFIQNIILTHHRNIVLAYKPDSSKLKKKLITVK